MLQRIAIAARELTTVNVRFLTSSVFRAATTRTLSLLNDPEHRSAQSERELAASPRAAAAHRDLSGAALALAGIRPADGPPMVNVVLSELRPNRMFAGVHTALDAAQRLSTQMGIGLRVVTLSELLGTREARDAEAHLLERFGIPISVVHRTAVLDTAFSRQDVWVVTHWTTAHPAQVACDYGVLDRRRVVYLIQDFEPGFHGWSTEHAVARRTYEADFLTLVNSIPLADYLEQQVGRAADAVFAPTLDDDRLREVAARREVGTLRVQFYGRPTKPRNMFGLGVAALTDAAGRLSGVPVEFVSAGERHADIDLGGTTLRSLGSLSRDDYFSSLSIADVVLSLQASPHPSHPPLEAAVSGALAVTNDFEGTRAGMHDRLRAVDADPGALGYAVAKAVEEAMGGPGSYAPMSATTLGGPLDDAVAAVAQRLEP